MQTTRAFRSFKPDPVDDRLLARCLEASTWAPSGGNQQPWRFVVLRSPAARQALAIGAQRALEGIVESYKLVKPAPDDDSKRSRMSRNLFALHEGAADVPAAILFCVRPLPLMPLLTVGSNIYPAMQNFLLAARACGLGTLVTGWQVGAEAELRQTIQIPDGWELAAMVIAGWPAGNFGPVRRKPVAEVSSLDTWDNPLVSPAE
jgi:nitroreductase